MRQKITIFVWDMGIGGVQRQVADVIRKLSTSTSQIEIDLWIKNKGHNYYPDLALISGVKIRYLMGTNAPGQSILDFLKVGLLLFTCRPDRILTFHDYLSLMILIWLKIGRLVINTRCIIFEPNLTSQFMKSRSRSKIWYWLMEKLYPLATNIIVTSKAAKLDLVENFNLSNERIAVVPTWALMPGETVFTIPKEKDIDLLFVGRLEAQKQPEEFVKVVRLLRDKYNLRLKAMMVGSGKKAEVVKELIDKYKLESSIKVTGAIAPECMTSIYNRAKVLLLTSKYEGMPLAVIEAMKLGILVIGYKYLGIDEIIKSGSTGIIVNDVASMADNTAKILSNDELRLSMGSKAQWQVQRQFGANNLQLFTEVLINGSCENQNNLGNNRGH